MNIDKWILESTIDAAIKDVNEAIETDSIKN